jgi:hypothetical protein
MKALSVHQPWAWLIAQGYKTIENRSWLTSYRGPILIHAGLKRADHADVEAVLSRLDWFSRRKIMREMPAVDSLPTGGIIGVIDLVACVTESTSPWFELGSFGFVLQHAHPIPFISFPGRLKLFDVEVEAVPGLAEALRGQGR